MIYTSTYKSPLGEMLMASDGTYLIGLWFEKQKYYGSKLLDETKEDNNLEIFKQTKQWLDKYFNGEQPNHLDLPLKPQGTKFRLLVWDILLKIPYTQTIRYGDIAKEVALKLNKPTMSAQAIGGAVGHNPISIIIPCHRVVGSDKSLTGYAGGLDRKVELLKYENVDLNQFKKVGE
ncbi:MAG: methylated-DNA--[protein]-cysteine S-methyltransferase [Erysipelotrichales bacterium]